MDERSFSFYDTQGNNFQPFVTDGTVVATPNDQQLLDGIPCARTGC
jgi:hypothetical protein